MAFLERVTSSVQRLTRRQTHRNPQLGFAPDHNDQQGDEKNQYADHSESSSDIPKMERNTNERTSKIHSKSDDWRRKEADLNETHKKKLDSLKQRMHMEKCKELDSLAANLKKKHDAELEAMLKLKEKELKTLRMQLQKSHQDHSVSRSRSGPLMNSASQDSIKSTRSQDYNHSRGRGSSDLANMREQISELRETVKRYESESKRKDLELRTIRENQDQEIQRMARDAQRHVKALLEELQQKERKIEKLERQLRLNEYQLSSTQLKYEYDSKKTAGERSQQQDNGIQIQAQPQVVDMKSASSSSSIIMASKFSAAMPVNTISKEEFEKEKQRWQQRMIELEASLKKSEETNAELAQSKAEMIRKNKDLEKVKKSLDEFNKRLTDRQKALNIENKQLEQKLKEAHDENIRATQSLDSVTLECNRLKEKRYNPDRDEELERLRQQNLEYCKCISALKQTILEKDRRLEVLQQKLRRSKRCRGGSDEENRSVNDLDFSASSMSLDTINEDYAEATKEELEISYRQLANEHLELQNICASLLRHANSEGGNGGNQDLRYRLQEVLHKIAQLEKNNNACISSALGVDASWAQEKLRYASLIRAMGEKIQILEAAQERLQQELGTTREENELLEFQVLELEHSQNEEYSACSSSLGVSQCKSLCDRSVSTSEDEGHFSMDHSLEENMARVLPLEELKIRFTLLKHRKELRPDDRYVVAQVKDLWENLQNEHAQCASKFIECEMRLRETESSLRSQLEALQHEKANLSPKSVKKFKNKELQRELESLQEAYLNLKMANATLEKESDDIRTEMEQLRAAYVTCADSEKRERTALEALRKQFDDLVISRQAEIEILEQASRQQAQTLAAMRTKIADLEQQIDRVNEENRSLSAELSDQRQTSTKTEELERLRKLNCEYQESLSEYKKLESCWTSERQNIERKYSDVKSKFKEAMKLIKEYEQSINKYGDRLKESANEKEEAKKIRILQEQRIADLERQCELLNKNSKPSRDDFLACKEVEEQLKAMLKEKTHEFEQKCVHERRILDEKSKLYKQLQHVKSYSAQLETQFEMQIQIVQALKVQLVELQKRDDDLRSEKNEEIDAFKTHLDAIHRLWTSTFPNANHATPCCNSTSDFYQQIAQLEELAMEMWQQISLVANSKLDADLDADLCCVKFHSITNCLRKIRGDKWEPIQAMITLCSAMIAFCEYSSRLRSKSDESEKTAQLCKEESDKTNARMELLQRQCRDSWMQKSDPVQCPAVKQQRSASSASLGHYEMRHPPVQQPYGNVLERIYHDLKRAMDDAQNTDPEALTKFRTRVDQLLVTNTNTGDGEIGSRTISPLDLCGSGTESELCDRSPLLSRKRRSTDGGGSFRSSGSDDVELKTRTDLDDQQKPTSSDHVTITLPPAPSNVRLAADLRNGRYLVCWSPPEQLADIQGYKIYVNEMMRKQVSNSHCTKTVIECNSDIDWTLINIRSVAGEIESMPVSIDIERSKKFVQNSAFNEVNTNGSKSKKDGRIMRSHDENDDEEECSEV